MKSMVVFVDDLGPEISGTQLAPALFKVLSHQAVLRQLEAGVRQVGGRRHLMRSGGHASFSCHRLRSISDGVGLRSTSPRSGWI